MATWEDGPEYAPAVRPELYQAPTHTVSLEAPPADAEPTSAPTVQPDAYDVPSQRPLADFEVSVADARDPEKPFTVYSSPAAPSGHRFGHQDDFDPRQPLLLSNAVGPAATVPPTPVVAGPPVVATMAPAFPPPTTAPAFPAPGTPGWFAPGTYSPPPAPRLTWGTWFKAMTPGVVITLALGTLLPFLAIFSLVASALFARLSPYKKPLTTLLAIVGGLWFLIAAITFFNLSTPSPWYFDLSDWTAGVSNFAQAACGVIVVVGGWIVADRLRHGESS